jgi:phosphate transport system permease protein
MSGDPRAVPERFLVGARTLRLDRFMTRLVTFGGVAIITAVFGIFAFIGAVAWPLFRGPSVTDLPVVGTAGLEGMELLALSAGGSLAYFYGGGADVVLLPTNGSPPLALPLALPEGREVTAWRVVRGGRSLLIGTADGLALSLDLRAAAAAGEPLKQLEPARRTRVGAGAVVLDADSAENGSRRLLGAVVEKDGRRAVVAAETVLRRDLMGGVEEEELPLAELALPAGFEPVEIAVPGTADSVLARSAAGEVALMFRGLEGWELRQVWQPFEGAEKLAGMHLLLGDVTLVCAGDQGATRLFQLRIDPETGARHFLPTHELRPLEGRAEWLVTSPRSKSFLAGDGVSAALVHTTTATVRHRLELPGVKKAVLDPRGEVLAGLAPGGLVMRAISDPHPEAGWRAFFAKVWYEGHSEPKWMWQSTGGSDDYEPKLSLVPLIIGSLKGTLYAMLFSVPVALLAAIYTSQFLSAGIRRHVKPVMEIMASLPSVVLGFLAALWLAPLVEDRVPSVMLAVAAVPLTALAAGAVWKRLPARWRNSMPAGCEFWLLAPLLLAALPLAWQAGPLVEKALFVATLGDGTRVADFRLWWPEMTGLPFDQRNSMVVGFMMGFAVIPVIFTIAEDALSNVPPALTSAAEALGASRWQVVRTVVLPVASAGVFSAMIIGLGRAVGETMIVVMATGNTPIMDESGRLLFGSHWNLFDGMRTLAANIAVELPEAAHGSTHYRTLFFGALVLFMMTFALNTVAELLRQHLRKRFRIL